MTSTPTHPGDSDLDLPRESKTIDLRLSPETFFTLSEAQRQLSAARLIALYPIASIDSVTIPACPICFEGDALFGTALLDLLHFTTPQNQLGIVAQNSIEGLYFDKRLFDRLSQVHYALSVTGGFATPTTVLMIKKIKPSEDRYEFRFGYAEDGTTIAVSGDYDRVVNSIIRSDPATIVRQSLLRLHQLTGDTKFVHALTLIENGLMYQEAVEETRTYDQGRFLHRLGFSPEVLRYMSTDTFATIITSALDGLTKRLTQLREQTDLTPDEINTMSEIDQAIDLAYFGNNPDRLRAYIVRLRSELPRL